VDDPRDAARELLRYIGAPSGTVNVLIRGATKRPRLIVWLSPTLRIPESRLPTRFGGFDVLYERRPSTRPLQFGAV
jgi:hypothetical protein